MARKKKEKALLMPKSKREIKYNLNLGKMIKEAIEQHKTLTQTELSSDINLTRMGFGHRLNNPTYGTAYDVIEISLMLKKDFVSPMLEVIRNNGIYEEEKYSREVVEELKEQVEHYKQLYDRLVRENNLLHNLIDGKK